MIQPLSGLRARQDRIERVRARFRNPQIYRNAGDPRRPAIIACKAVRVRRLTDFRPHRIVHPGLQPRDKFRIQRQARNEMHAA